MSSVEGEDQKAVLKASASPSLEVALAHYRRMHLHHFELNGSKAPIREYKIFGQGYICYFLTLRCVAIKSSVLKSPPCIFGLALTMLHAYYTIYLNNCLFIITGNTGSAYQSWLNVSIHLTQMHACY